MNEGEVWSKGGQQSGRLVYSLLLIFTFFFFALFSFSFYFSTPSPPYCLFVVFKIPHSTPISQLLPEWFISGLQAQLNVLTDLGKWVKEGNIEIHLHSGLRSKPFGKEYVQRTSMTWPKNKSLVTGKEKTECMSQAVCPDALTQSWLRLS